jgi:Ca2+-binding RTX toxin-like protein
VGILNDTVIIAWQDNGTPDNQKDIFVVRSENGGETFLPGSNISNNGSDSENPKVGIWGNNVTIAWNEMYEPLAASSKNGGATFSPPTNLLKDYYFSVSPLIHQVKIFGNTVIIALTNKSGRNQVFVASSINAGDTFAINDLDTQVEGGPTVPQIGISGKDVFVAWRNGEHRDRHGVDLRAVFLARSGDGGQVFFPKIRLSDGWDPLMAVSGNTVIVLWERKDGVFFARPYDQGVTPSAPSRIPNSNPEYSTLSMGMGVGRGEVPILVDGVNTIKVPVNSSSDDAEENILTGYVNSTSTHIELVYNTKRQKQQTVGLRFNNVTLPPGAKIVNSYIQFTADQGSSGTVLLKITGEKVSTSTFKKGSKSRKSKFGDILSRVRTTANVSWFPSEWYSKGDKGFDQQTSNIASIIEEIVGQSSWKSGNSLAIIIMGDGTGTGTRIAKSFDDSIKPNGDPLNPPMLHVEYKTASTSQPPTPPSPSGVTCNGLPATIVGTEVDNRINGTQGPDVIAGLGGNDTIKGNGGDDVICGGEGQDKLYGDKGNDLLIGGAGNDQLDGGPGRDALDGGLGIDKCAGGKDKDTDTAVACETVRGVP